MDSRSQLHDTLLVKYFAPQWRRVVGLALLLVGGIALQLVNPLIVRYVLDTATAGAAMTGLVLAAALFIVFNGVQFGASLAVNYVGEGVSWTATNALRADLARHCLRLDMDFHSSHTPGELIARIDGDVSELASFFSQLVLRVVANGLLIAGVIALLFREDWRMGAAAVAYAAATALALQWVQPRNVRRWGALRHALAGLDSYLEERLAGREDVRANGAEGYVLRGLALAQGAAFQAAFRARHFGAFIFALTHLLFVLATALGFGVGIYLFLQGQVTIGTVYLIVYYLAILRSPLEQIRDQVGELQQSTASIQRIRGLFAVQPKVREQPAPQQPGPAAEVRTPGGLEVRFDRVSFGYALPAELRADAVTPGLPDDGAPRAGATVLHDLSFTLAPGQVLGLLGRTGSGKTTLTRLLFRLYDPDAGSIVLGGRDIRTLPLSTLRREVGMVSQDVQLFQATLRDNIALFKPDVDDAQILAALRELGLWPWYAAQPHGLDTQLEPGGHGLSAGEAQLLAFARVFLKDPGLVILDEPSARLDPATEALLERATDGLLAGRTGIIIAHRLRTVERADAILILDRGCMVELGSRPGLAADPSSRFHHLLQTGLEEALA